MGTVETILLLEVAVLAKHSISITELLRDADQQNPRQAALMGNLEKMHAKRKVVSLFESPLRKRDETCLWINSLKLTLPLQSNYKIWQETVQNAFKYNEIEP